MWPDGVQPLVSAPQIVQRGAGQAGVFHSWSLLCLSVEWSGTEWRETLESICEPFAVRKGDRVAVQAFRVGYKKSEIVNFLIEH